MSENQLIYAIVVNWNKGEDTLECLQSLRRQKGFALRLLVVDNGSTDNSLQMIKEMFPEAEVLSNLENLGFGYGANQGIVQAFQSGADYILLINNDATLADDGLMILMEHIRDGIGILAPVIYYAKYPETIWSAGAKINAWNLETIEERRGQKDSGNLPGVLDQDFITGCAMLLPRHTYEKVGVFDTGFPMYYEDLDYSLRVRRAGYHILVIARAKAWHKVAMSSGGGDSPNERYWMARSSVYFFRKHANLLQLPVIALWRTGSAIRTSLRLLRRRNLASLKAYWRGLVDGLSKPYHPVTK